jgi:hypothetical protein
MNKLPSTTVILLASEQAADRLVGISERLGKDDHFRHLARKI